MSVYENELFTTIACFVYTPKQLLLVLFPLPPSFCFHPRPPLTHRILCGSCSDAQLSLLGSFYLFYASNFLIKEFSGQLNVISDNTTLVLFTNHASKQTV